MPKHQRVLAAFAIAVAALLGHLGTSAGQQNSVTAIDVVLEPDAKMIWQANVANARLRNVYAKGFALGPTHHPHLSISPGRASVYHLGNFVTARQGLKTWELKP